MKIILSPTKTMEKQLYAVNTRPHFQSEAEIIFAQLKETLAETTLEKFYKCSAKKAVEIQTILEDFARPENKSTALFSYTGLVFKYLNAQDFSEDDLQFAQEHLRIASGLYGILCPFDTIFSYRLDFENPLKMNGENLARFWQEKYQAYFEKETLIFNLASKEYATPIQKALQPKTKFCNFLFLDQVNGEYKTKATNAKMARGIMAREIIKGKITNLEAALQLTPLGYRYQTQEKNDYIFINESSSF